MTIISTTYFCLTCKKGPFSELDLATHGCPAPFSVVKSVITCQKKPWGRFIDCIFSLDIGFFLAFSAAVIMNVIIIPHLGLTAKEGLIEGFCLGLVLMRLFKDK